MEKKPKSKGDLSRPMPRSASFTGRFSGEPLQKILNPKSKAPATAPAPAPAHGPMRRPQTHPELLRRDKPAFERTPWLNLASRPAESETVNNKRKSAAKVVVNVTVGRSIGPLRLLIGMDATVVDVVKAALAQYAKEGRAPILTADLLSFGLHYSQFTIDCLNPSDKMKDLGCRNFFLFPKKESLVSCGTEMGKCVGDDAGKEAIPWYHFINRFLAIS